MTESSSWHEQIEGVAPFALPEAATIAGKTIEGSKARVYWLLRLSAERGVRHRVGALEAPAGWVPNYYLRKGWSGGNAGDRRLRDLRALGVELESQDFRPDRSDPSYTVLWRWKCDPVAVAGGDVPALSRPQAQGGKRGGFGFETKGAVASRAPEGSEGRTARRLRFWTAVGFPGQDAPGRVDLAPHARHLLALPGPSFADVVVGKLPADRALQHLREKLRSRFRELRQWLDAGGEHTLWISIEHQAAVDPLPTLVDVLTRCGAEYLGDWSEGRRVA